MVYYGNIAPGLPQRLLRNYMFNNGAKFTVTKKEILIELRPITSLLLSQKFIGDLRSAATAGGKGFSGKYSLKSGTALNGSLGQFTTDAKVTVPCVTVSSGGQIHYSAKGTATLKDTWDFDWQLGQYILGKIGMGPGNGRTWYGQWRTIIGSTIPGNSFPVDSETVDVSQSEAQTMLHFQ